MSKKVNVELTEASEKLDYMASRLYLRGHIYLTQGGYVAVITGPEVDVRLYADTLDWALDDAKAWLLAFDDLMAVHMKRALG